MKTTSVAAVLSAALLLVSCAGQKKPENGGAIDKGNKRTQAAQMKGAPSDFKPAAGDENIKNSEVAYNLGLEYAGKGEMPAAHHYIDLAIILQPDSKYSYTKGLFLLGDKRYDEALVWLERSLQQGPGTSDNKLAVQNALGATYMQLGQDEKALAQFRDVVNAPGIVSRYESYYNMGIIYLRQQKWLDAEAVFQKVAEENPGYYRAYGKLGQISAHKEDWGQAALLYKRALDLIQNDYPSLQTDGAELYCNYGEALFHEKMYPESRQALMQVLRISPESSAGQKAKEILAKLGSP